MYKIMHTCMCILTIRCIKILICLNITLLPSWPLQLVYIIYIIVLLYSNMGIATCMYMYVIFFGTGPATEQQWSQRPHRRRNCEPDVSRCSEVYGLDDLPAHDLVCPIPNSALPHLPLHHHGVLHLCWFCCHGSPHPCQCGHCHKEQTTAGIYMYNDI